MNLQNTVKEKDNSKKKMINWKQKFTENSLNKGYDLAQNKKVFQLKQEENRISAVVSDLKSYNVLITYDEENGPKILKCKCPKARGNSACEHQAAVFFAIEKMAEEKLEEELRAEQKKFEMQLLKELREKEEQERLAIAEQKRLYEEQKERKRQEKKAKSAERKAKKLAAAALEKERLQQEKLQQEEAERQRILKQEQETREKEEERKRMLQEQEAAKIRKEEQKALRREKKKEKQLEETMKKTHAPEYSYYNYDRMKKSYKIPKKIEKEAQELIENCVVENESLDSGYMQGYDEPFGVYNCEFEDGNVQVEFVFGKNAIKESVCNCEYCSDYFHRFYYGEEPCKYKAAAMYYLEQALASNPVGDATDYAGQKVIDIFSMNNIQKDNIQSSIDEKESIQIVPRVKKGFDNSLELSFKIGSKRLYVLKDWEALCEKIEKNAPMQLGKNNAIVCKYDNFTAKSKRWIDFIRKLVKEQERFRKQLENMSYWGRDYGATLNGVTLEDWVLDDFFDIGISEEIELQQDSFEKKKKSEILIMSTDMPLLQMKLSPYLEKKAFEGIDVDMSFPCYIRGEGWQYFLEGNTLHRIDGEEIMPIISMLGESGDEYGSFRVGRRHLADFYYQVLPKLEEYFEIEDQCGKYLEKYLASEVSFQFYLDAQNQNILCQVKAVYDKDEVILTPDNLAVYDGGHMRQAAREHVILLALHSYLPHYSEEGKVFHCSAQEELVFRFMEQGVDFLSQYGEVFCTDKYDNMRIVKNVHVSVGVSVSEGLLDLSVSTEDLTEEELLDALKHYQPNKKYHRLKNGAFINLQDENIRLLQEMVENLNVPLKEFVKGKMHLPLYRTLYLDHLLEEHEEIYSKRDSYVKNIAKRFKTIKDAEYDVPEQLNKTLRGYQKNGYRWLRTLTESHFGGILADDMGLGKTLQTITMLLAYKQEHMQLETTVERNEIVCDMLEATGEIPVGIEKNRKPSLIITPASLVYNWADELQRFAPELSVLLLAGTQQERQQQIRGCSRYDVVVCSYDVLKRDIDQYENQSFAYEIIDEAQHIKNHTTAAAKAVKVIKAEHKLALTGTPIENRLSELWSIFDYLMPGFLYSYSVFKKQFETPIVKNQDEEVAKQLQTMVAPFILRRLKAEVLKDLPEKIEEVRSIPLEGKQQKLYDAQVVHMKTVLAAQKEDDFNQNKLQVLAELTKLRQICCDPALCFDNYSGESTKLESCLELIENATEAGHKMLLFSQFTSMLDIIGKKLKKLGIPYYTITGSTTKEKRLQLVKAFNKDQTPVFLISLKAGGVGLNLTGADMVIHYDPWWNVAVQNQATDRAHRMGQTQKVVVYKMIAKNSIEEKILKLQETKKDLADQIVNTEGGNLAQMTQEDILALLS